MPCRIVYLPFFNIKNRNALNLHNVDSCSKINSIFIFGKEFSARQDNPTKTLDKSEEHDFSANLDLFHLEDKMMLKTNIQKSYRICSSIIR